MCYPDLLMVTRAFNHRKFKGAILYFRSLFIDQLGNNTFY